MQSEFLSLFNKYRPRTLKDLVGQEHVSLTLTKALEKGRLNPAYLMTGSRGCGKTTTARILAMGYNCEKGVTPNPCGVCQVCQDILNDRCIDIVEVDAGSRNKVDDIKELTASTYTVPTMLRTKFYILDEVHRLTPQAQDSFLKTLEEPAPNVVFILCTTEPEKLKDTIVSRTQYYEFRRIPIEKIQDRLRYITEQEKYTADPQALMEIARGCAGGMRDAIGKLEQAMCATDGSHITLDVVSTLMGATGMEHCPTLISAIIDKNVEQIFQTIGKVSDGTASLIPFYTNILTYLRNMVATASNPDCIKLLDVGDHVISKIQEQIKQVSPQDILFWLKKALEYGRMIDSIKGRMVLETMCLDMVYSTAQQQNARKHSDSPAVALPEVGNAAMTMSNKITWDKMRALVRVPVAFILDGIKPQPYYENGVFFIFSMNLDDIEIKHLQQHEDELIQCLGRAGFRARIVFQDSSPRDVNKKAASEVFGG